MSNNSNFQPNLRPDDTLEQIENPQTNEEVYLGSFSAILQNNLGVYVICEFLIGTNNLVQKEGILYSGGINFITLYQPSEDQYVVCDLYSLKFVTFIDKDSPASGDEIALKNRIAHGRAAYQDSAPASTGSNANVSGSVSPTRR